MAFALYPLLLTIVANAAASPADDVFGTRITPLLQDRCLRCHNATKPSGGLDLSSRAALVKGGDSGPALLSGDADKSLLVAAVTGTKPKMPRGGPPLTTEQIADLRKWIDAGVPWPEKTTLTASVWWSLATLKQPVPPAVAGAKIRSPIDAFIQAKLQASGLRPSPEADKPTLLRRVTFDVTGLPPTSEELDSFVNDVSADAYEKVVDRLLASPRYGERWGRHWLDVVHYGDTHGYDKDYRRDHAWPYRDYVIDSFNVDKPYARFIEEQVAGDVLFPRDPAAVAATGFLAAGPWDFVGQVELREGTVDKEKTRLLDRDDMLSNTVGTFLSLTAHCARCHDHKFDPIPQKDYYRLQAVFSGVERGDRPYADPRLAKARRAAEEQLGEAIAARDKLHAKVAAVASPELARLDRALADCKAKLAELPQTKQKPSPSNGYHSGIEATPDVVKWVQVDLGKSQSLDVVHLIPARPVDFADTPGFGFPQRFKVEIADDPTFAKSTVLLDQTGSDYPNPGESAVPIFAKGQSGRYIRVTAVKLWPRTNDFVFALAELEVESAGRNVARGVPVSALDSIEGGLWSKAHLVDGYDSRFELVQPKNAVDRDALRRRRELESLLQTTTSARRSEADRLIDGETRRSLAQAQAAVAAAEARLKPIVDANQVYTVIPRVPRPIHVLHRGDVEQPRDLVGPAAMSAVTGPDDVFANLPSADEGARRAALARWIADPRNPLTWRSIVNRIWHYHFGRGLVDTPNDFGRNGAAPTHPELLDWLAVEFRDGGGSFKKLHRLILTSAAYRQSSAVDPASAKIDADNRLLWRMNRTRLDAEELRDAILSVSGRLDLTPGGPGYELFRYRFDFSPEYDHTALEKIKDPATFRRTVYRFIVRSVPNPFLDCLDCADPNLNVPVRNTTLTALQALAMLNDPFVLHQSRLFAQRLQSASDVPRVQATAAYRLAFGRPPTEAERTAWLEYAVKHGLPNACRILFNANEFVFID